MLKMHVVVMVLILLVSSAARAQRDTRFVNNTIHVQVRLPGGRMAPQGIMVLLESQESGVVAQGQTDPQGKVTFNPRNPAVYTVTVRYPGYQEDRARADLQTSPSAFLIFELRPERGRTQNNVGVGGTTSVATAAVPEKAMKEFKTGEKLLMKDQKPEESLRHFKKAIQLHEPFTDAYAMLGFAYLAERNAKDAEVVLLHALKLDPKSAIAHLELGAAYNLQKRYPEAEQELTTGLGLNDNAAEGHYELARTYWATNRWQQAEPHAEKAVSLQPNLAAAHVLLGNIRLRKNDLPSAKREFERYVQLEPNGPMAESARAMISKLAGSAK